MSKEGEDDRLLGLQGDTEAECDVDTKADAADVPASTADTDNTPQCLNKALEGLPPRYVFISCGAALQNGQTLVATILLVLKTIFTTRVKNQDHFGSFHLFCLFVQMHENKNWRFHLFLLQIAN